MRKTSAPVGDGSPRRIELTIEPGTDLIVHVAGTGSGAGDLQEPPPAPRRQNDAIEDAIKRLEEYGSPHLREAANGLRDLGYLLVAPAVRVPGKRAEAYVRFHDPGRPGAAVGYLTPQNISFTRDRKQLENEQGGRIIPSTGEVAFSHMDSAQRGLEVAARLKVTVPMR
jgi:hypothetical protein